MFMQDLSYKKANLIHAIDGISGHNLNGRIKKQEKPRLSMIEKAMAQIIARRIYKQIKNYINMKSWKTTLGGALGALGTYLATVDDPAWLQIIGQVCIGLGMLIMGMSARDNGVTSKQAGAE